MAEAPARWSTADWAVLRFTVVQAVLSAALSVAFAVPLARALARRRFPGRETLLLCLGAPFIVPVIVATLGVLAIWGRSGLVSDGLGALGLPALDIYGLPGILLAHVFFNLPLATRMLLSGWWSIPAEQHRLADQLGFNLRERFRILEMPMLREVVPGALLLIFLICLTSFAVALTLGGGPRATTLELAIYQAVRFEFDLSRAASLSLVQVSVALGVAIFALALTRPAMGLDGVARGVSSAGPRQGRIFDGAVLVVASGFLLLPLAAIGVRGLPGLLSLPPNVPPAALRSLIVALASGAFATSLALAIAWTLTTPGARWRGLLGEGLVLVGLTASPLVIGTGLFVLIRPLLDPFAVALWLTALVNAALGVPFALRILVPAVAQVRRSHERLAQQLDLPPALWRRRVLLPGIRRPLGLAMGLVAAFSTGDLGIIALFGSSTTETLPLVMFGLMGAYRTQEALSAALLLAVMAFGFFAIFDHWGRRHDPR
ncbi:MAG: thiamine/thiamine pyrophosphate ABC transporter permease ThiP [Pseudomonadota bacterium]